MRESTGGERRTGRSGSRSTGKSSETGAKRSARPSGGRSSGERSGGAGRPSGGRGAGRSGNRGGGRRTMAGHVVPRLFAGKTLIDFLAERLGVSNRKAKGLIDERVVWVNRQLVWIANHILRSGDTVEFPSGEDKRTPFERKHVRVLWEDDHYLFADKPAGVLSVGRDSAEEILREQTGCAALRAVHRLDKDTSGANLFAKTAAGFEGAVSVFKTRQVLKVYNAIVMGRIDRGTSTIAEDLEGERAVTHMSKIAANDDISFVRLRIETGRTHQIRKHLSGIRHPILGDHEYGMKRARDPRIVSVARQMLHSVEIEMPHPLKPGEKLRAHSPLPADFRRTLKLFGLGK